MNEDRVGVRVRVAPSPTGQPHVGTAYAALFNYAYARRYGGAMILRIEDTDRLRSSKRHEEAVVDSLRWLGLSWDEGPDVGGPHAPYRQSERGKIYSEFAERMLDTEQAYPCFCSVERLEELRSEQRRKKSSKMGYDGFCRSLGMREARGRIEKGDEHTLRLRMPDLGRTVLKDGLRGDIVFENSQVDDPVLIKSDGIPTYHFANVVDDHLMGITDVIRAEEWISSAPKHLALYRAFDWAPPRFFHLPLLRNNDKQRSKISKRRSPVALKYYRDIGILPEAMLNFLALMGWSFGDDREVFSLDEMIDRFDLRPGSTALGGSVFDLEKLVWLNGHHIRGLSDQELVRRLRQWRLGDDYLEVLAPLAKPRIRRLDEFVDLLSYCFRGGVDHRDSLNRFRPRTKGAGETAKILVRSAELVDEIESFESDLLDARFRELANANEWSTRELFALLRAAVTAQKASPSLFEIMSAIGRELCHHRLRAAASIARGFQ